MQHIMRTLDLGEASKPEVILLKLMGNLLKSRDEVFGPQSGASAQAFSNMIHAMSFTQSEIHEFPEETLTHEESNGHEHAMKCHHTAQVPDDDHKQSGAGTTEQPSHPIPDEAGNPMFIQAGQELASEASVPRNPECVQKSSVLSHSPQPFQQDPQNKASGTSEPRLPDDVQKVDRVMSHPQPYRDECFGAVNNGEPQDTPALSPADASGHRSHVGNLPTFPAATQKVQSDNGDASADAHGPAFPNIRPPPIGHQITAAKQGHTEPNASPTITSPKCHALDATVQTIVTPLVQFAAADVSDPGQNAHNVQTPKAEVVQMHPVEPGQYPVVGTNDRCPEPMQSVPFANPIHPASAIPFLASEVGYQKESVADRSCAAVKPMHPIPSTKWFPTPQPAAMQMNRPMPSSQEKQACATSDEHSKQISAISKSAPDAKHLPTPTMAPAAHSKHATDMPSPTKELSQPYCASHSGHPGPIPQTQEKRTELSKPYKDGAACTASALISHQQTQHHSHDEANKTTAVSQQDTIELAAIAKLFEATQQNIAIGNPPPTGGVIGFETSKRRKIQHPIKTRESKTTGEKQPSPETTPNTRDSSEAHHPNQDGKASDEGPQLPVQMQKPHTLQALPSQITAEQTGQPEQALSITEPKTEEQTPSQQHFPLPSHESKMMNHANPPAEGAKHQHSNTYIPENAEASDKTIQIWIIRDDRLEPDEIKVPVGTTPGQLTQAEARLMTMVQPIFPRSWIGTPLPLYEPLEDKQVVYLHQQPPSIKCPAITGIQPSEVVQPPVCRIHVLWKQQAWVALDEMQFYLEGTIASEDTKVFQPKTYFHEAAADEEAGVWLHRPLTEVDDKSTFVSAAIVQGHWIPVKITRHDRCIQLTTTPEGSCFLRAAQEITADLGLTLEVHQKVLPQAFAADCGFQAFAWIVAMSSGHQPTALPAHKAEQWRYMFAHHLLQTDHHTDIIHNIHLGGMKIDSENHQQLIKLLCEHGVWPDRAQDRADKVLEKLPVATLKSILASKKPWPDLKHAANQIKPPLKLIMQDELDAQIAARAKHRAQFGRKPAKASQKNTEQSKDMITIKAADLQVPEGVFKQHDGKVLGPLRAEQVGNNAEGVVLIDEEDSHAVLKLPTPVTQKGLAVLVLATKENANQHESEPIRFPALCLSTQEPLIAAGYLYQLGTQIVQRHEPQVKIAVDERDTEAIRCLVFQDQTSLWEAMQSHPVKTVFASEPLLQHDRASEPVVIDVWDRQWVTKRFEKTKNKAAEMFVFSFRMLADKASELVSKSGANGIYFEPRSACGRFPSNTHHVTWIPNATFQEAKFAQQTSPQTTSLVRHADRYGLRSDTMNALEIHNKHRPDTPLLMGPSKMLYALGPLPYSTTKDAVTKLLKAWGWEARPLQPRGRSQDGSGITWTIQATTDPSHWIYVLQHGDVLISKLQDDKPAEIAPTYSVVASKKTIMHLNQNVDQDPWLMNDPWKQQHKHKQPATAAAAAAASQFASLPPAIMANMEANIEKKLLANLGPKFNAGDSDVTMDHGGLDSRVTQLEDQLQQIQRNQGAFEQKLCQVDQTIMQVQTTQHGVENTVNQLQIQMEHQNQQISQTLDRKMSEQMDRIEALLCKRGRHE